MNLYRANNQHANHLYVLISHLENVCGIKSGLYHVTEHVCLIDKTRGRPNHFRCGYTCLSHMGLYFETINDSVWLDETIKRLSGRRSFSLNSVNLAKKEVIIESRALFEESKRKEQIVRFITENRVRSLPIGCPSAISKIKRDEVIRVWDEILEKDRICFFKFKSKEELYNSLNIKKILEAPDTQDRVQILTPNKKLDDVIILTSKHTCKLKIYLQIPPILTKKETLAKAFAEYYFQEMMKRQHKRNIIISDFYITQTEAFLVGTIKNLETQEIGLFINQIRDILSRKIDALNTFNFNPFISALKDAISNESIVDCLNKIENKIVYKKPVFLISDIDMISISFEDVAQALRFAYKQGLKVIAI